MAGMDHEKANRRQLVNKQNNEGRTYGDNPVRRKQKRWQPHKLSNLNKATVNALYSKLVNRNGVDADKAFGIVRDEMFRHVYQERERASRNKSNSTKRNRRKR